MAEIAKKNQIAIIKTSKIIKKRINKELFTSILGDRLSYMI